MFISVILVVLYIFVVLLFTAIPIILVCCSMARSLCRYCMIEIEDMEHDIERNAANAKEDSYFLIVHCQGSIQVDKLFCLALDYNYSYDLTMVNVTMLNHGDFLKRPIFLDANQNASADNSSPFYDVTAISFLTLLIFLFILPFVVCLCVFALCVAEQTFERPSNINSIDRSTVRYIHRTN